MGGAGYLFTGDNDSAVMHNSALINLNVLEYESACRRAKSVLSSSACVYPAYNQIDPDNPNCSEDSVYPAEPDSEYGWEKLFSERLYLSYNRNYGIGVRIARFHNLFGPEGTGPVDGRKLLPQYVARWPRRRMAARSRFGEMANRRARSCTLANASRACGG